MMECGHHEQCQYRFRHKGVVQKYCMACICEHSGVPKLQTKEFSEFAKNKGKVNRLVDKDIQIVEKKLKKVESDENKSE